MAVSSQDLDWEREVKGHVVARNRRARFEYEVGDLLEVGLSLLGSEVKALREGHCKIEEAYVLVEKGQLYIRGLYIGPYKMASIQNHDPFRRRKLLAKKKEIERLAIAVERKGFSLLPLEIYFTRGLAKMSIALGKGKKSADKRETIKKRDVEREIASKLKGRG